MFEFPHLEQAKHSFVTSRQRRQLLQQEKQALLHRLEQLDSQIQSALQQEQHDRECFRAQRQHIIGSSGSVASAAIVEEDDSLLILMNDILVVICSYLNLNDLVRMELTCQRLYKLLSSLTSHNNNNGKERTRRTSINAPVQVPHDSSNGVSITNHKRWSSASSSSIIVWNQLEESSNIPVVGRSTMKDARSRIKHYVAASHYAKYIQSQTLNQIVVSKSHCGGDGGHHYRTPSCRGCTILPTKLNLHVFQCPDEYEFFFRFASFQREGGFGEEEIIRDDLVQPSYYTMVQNTFTNNNNNNNNNNNKNKNERSKHYNEKENEEQCNLIWEGFVPVSKNKPKDMVETRSMFFDMKNEYKSMTWPSMKYFLMMVSMIEEEEDEEALNTEVAATEGIAVVDPRQMNRTPHYQNYHNMSIPTIDSLAITMVAIHIPDKQLSFVASSYGATKYAECPVLRMKNTEITTPGDYKVENDRAHLWLRISTSPKVKFLGIDLD